MIPETRRFEDPARAAPESPQAARGFRDRLGDLFPLAPQASARTWHRRTLSVVAQAAAAGVATVVLLLRVPGLPSWDTIYGEDYWEYFTQALQRPWHLFVEYNGYWQLIPRVVAQFATYLPLSQAAAAFAVAGALIAACCALFAYHASAGHIQSAKLRALLAAALVLLPVAPMEVIDSGVNSIWYLMTALFWAALWRPRTRAGMALAAAIAFATVSTNILGVLFLPLLAARLYVLRHPGEHAVTAGWLAGCLAQAPFVIAGALRGNARLATHATPGQSLGFYGHSVLLPSAGWHLSWWLRSLTGLNGATAIVAVLLAVIVGVILRTQAQARAFVVTALLTGFVAAVVGITVNGHLVTAPLLQDAQPGSRYTVLPIFLIEAALIEGADHAVRRRAAWSAWSAWSAGYRRQGWKPAMAVTALVAVLAATWAVDFRYAGWRSGWSWTWAPIAAKWEHDCAHSTTGYIVEKAGYPYQRLPCANMRR